MWYVFIFSAVNQPLPKYLVVFIESDSLDKAKGIFKDKIKLDPDKEGYENVIGISQKDAWQAALDKQLINASLKLEDVLQLPEVIVFSYDSVANTKNYSGMSCARCNEIFPYADGPNQPNGTFKCYKCRNYK